MRLLVTGSGGLIGSEVSAYFGTRGCAVHGLDNNQRAIFFGPEADTRWNWERLEATLPNYTHHELDVRDRQGVLALVDAVKPEAIVHAAAQPSHERSAQVPFEDFETNAVGTLNLLEATRRFAQGACFVYLSTSKVYGDGPNRVPLVEHETRWDFAEDACRHGISETFSIDQSQHSLLGASKLAGDILVQEYARTFGLKTCCLRGGCLTGPAHTGVELHGFLSYLVRCNLAGRPYRVLGYKGKQVRDNIHSFDVARFIERFLREPRPGEVYNIGGGRDNSCSILEAFGLVETVTGKPMVYEYVEQHRDGDHICYYSDLRKIKSHYPGWDVSRYLPSILEEITLGWRTRLGC